MSSLAETVGGTQGYMVTFYSGIAMLVGLVVITFTLKDTAKKV